MMSFQGRVGATLCLRHYVDNEELGFIVIDCWDVEHDGEYVLLLNLKTNKIHSYWSDDWELVDVLSYQPSNQLSVLIQKHQYLRRSIQTQENKAQNILKDIALLHKGGYKDNVN